LTDAVTLILIGYWRSETHPEWPDPADLVDPQWDAQERHMVTMYLASGTIARTYMGFSPCRLCGRQNGSLEYTDGEFIWPEGLAHYLEGTPSGSPRLLSPGSSRSSTRSNARLPTALGGKCSPRSSRREPVR
jgi:hypothetical protein